MCIKKKLLAVAVALGVAVPSSFAAWDLFPVIEQGSVEANINSDQNLKIRYGVIENLEVFSANYSSLLSRAPEYTLGARYQIVPEMFSAYADLGIPHGNGVWGLTPGVQFSTNFTETISLGADLGLPLHLNHPEWADTADASKRGFGLDLVAGFELDIAVSEQVTFWLGVDFAYGNLTNAGMRKTEAENREFEAKEALSPAIGVSFSKDNLTVGTWLGIDLTATNDKGNDSVGLNGGVDFTIKF